MTFSARIMVATVLRSMVLTVESATRNDDRITKTTEQRVHITVTSSLPSENQKKQVAGAAVEVHR